MNPLGKQLRIRARLLGLSDAAVARRLAISQSRYANYVNGMREPGFEMLVRICRILQTTPNQLLEFDEAATQKLAARPEIGQIAALVEGLNSESLKIAVVLLSALSKNQDQWPAKGKRGKSK